MSACMRLRGIPFRLRWRLVIVTVFCAVSPMSPIAPERLEAFERWPLEY